MAKTELEQVKELVSNRLDFIKVLMDMKPQSTTNEEKAYDKGFEKELSFEIKFLEKLLKSL